jgi:hypothetical protein
MPLFVCVCVCVCVCVQTSLFHGSGIEIRGQLSAGSSLLHLGESRDWTQVLRSAFVSWTLLCLFWCYYCFRRRSSACLVPCVERTNVTAKCKAFSNADVWMTVNKQVRQADRQRHRWQISRDIVTKILNAVKAMTLETCRTLGLISSRDFHCWKANPRAGEMAPRLRALVNLAESFSSVPNTYMVTHNYPKL